MGIIEAAAPFLAAFRAGQGQKAEPTWLDTHRSAAMDRFAETGYPTRKQETWRFTDLRPLTRQPILPAEGKMPTIDLEILAPFRLPGAAHRMVFVNGVFAPALSDLGTMPKGVWMGSTAEALTSRPELLEAAFDASETTGAQPLSSLNAAFFVDGVVLALEPDAELLLPLEIIHVGSAGDAAAAFHLRNAFILGANSRATVIETAIGSGSGWTNAVCSVSLGDGAGLRHIKLQKEAPSAIHTALVRASVAQAASYESFLLTLGAKMSREDIQVALSGDAACFTLNGAYLLRDDQEATIAPFVDHQALGCQTNEVLKGVMQDRAHGVFLGTVAVRPGADQTNANQLNRNLLLSPQASVDTKPELEILADDVKCSHGATIGSLDEAALFYLLARGIDVNTARQMLIEAFAADVIDSAELGETLTPHLHRHLKNWLDGLRTAA
jgi:Fe-S cluster assembly protein SufD